MSRFADVHLRIARPVRSLERSTVMYRDGLQLEELGRFADHGGFDGVMLGRPRLPYHFELTHCRFHPVLPAPTPEDLIVFYLPDLAAAGVVASALRPPPSGAGADRPRFKAVAFDAFPIFDPRPVSARAEMLFPGRGAELINAWRTRQFEYQWLHSLAGRYSDFWNTTEEGLVYAARQLRLELTSEKRAQLMQPYIGLTSWPDVPAALTSLKSSGMRLAFLSNMTRKMLDAGIRASKLEGLFEHVLSTDRVRTHKPDPRAYQLALDAFGLEREEILFVAFAGWDAAGAKWFGYPTFWVNRLDAPPEELGVRPDGVGRDLNDLQAFVAASR